MVFPIIACPVPPDRVGSAAQARSARSEAGFAGSGPGGPNSVPHGLVPSWQRRRGRSSRDDARWFQAQPEQVVQDGGVHVSRDHGRDGSVAGERLGGVAFQPRGAVTPNHRRGGARITAGWKRCGVAGQPVNVADDDHVLRAGLDRRDQPSGKARSKAHGSARRTSATLTDWNAFEKACVRHGVRLSAYTGGKCGATARATSIEGVCALGVSPGPGLCSDRMRGRRRDVAKSRRAQRVWQGWDRLTSDFIKRLSRSNSEHTGH